MVAGIPLNKSIGSARLYCISFQPVTAGLATAHPPGCGFDDNSVLLID
jgi:hypothetical protein